jgi:hypothetical protein
MIISHRSALIITHVATNAAFCSTKIKNKNVFETTVFSLEPNLKS